MVSKVTKKNLEIIDYFCINNRFDYFQIWNNRLIDYFEKSINAHHYYFQFFFTNQSTYVPKWISRYKSMVILQNFVNFSCFLNFNFFLKFFKICNFSKKIDFFNFSNLVILQNSLYFQNLLIFFWIINFFRKFSFLQYLLLCSNLDTISRYSIWWRWVR